MPKETIQTGTANDPTSVHVGWQRDGWVQLATSGTKHAVDAVPEVEETGIYVDLDRNQINRLIRNLRRARDQAYGADE